jgi:hypothetical protein
MRRDLRVTERQQRGTNARKICPEKVAIKKTGARAQIRIAVEVPRLGWLTPLARLGDGPTRGARGVCGRGYRSVCNFGV